MVNDFLYVPVGGVFALDDLDLSSASIRGFFDKSSLCLESVSDCDGIVVHDPLNLEMFA